MKNREKLEAIDKKLRLYYLAEGKCEVCGKSVRVTESQLAHRIGQTKRNLKKYGKEIIHSPANLALVCGLKCNSAVDISFRPEEIKKLLKEIEDETSR